MSKKKKNQIISTRMAGTPAERELQHLRHKDLQRACVGRGMPFEDVVSSDIPTLQGWFCKHYDNSQNLVFLDEFDDWMAEQLRAAGYSKGDPVFHSDLRLGFIGVSDADDEGKKTKKPRLKSLDKKEKPKRERVEGTKVFKGTKKALTYQLASSHTLAQVTEQVMEQFPEAKPKSISIWYKRALSGTASKDKAKTKK